MNKITIKARDDFENFFSNSGYFGCEKLSQYPYVVFNEINPDEENSELLMEIITSHKDLLKAFRHRPETKVMQQWAGKWSSHFITFTVGDVIAHIKSNDILKEQFHKFL